MKRRFGMKKISCALAVAGAVLLGAGALSAAVTMTIPSGYFAKNLGKSALADPSGVAHTKEEVAGKVVVALFSAPTPSQGDLQKQWSSGLADALPKSVAFVLVEDMTQAGLFKGIALSEMKKEFSPHDRPFLILDQNGAVVKKFGVPKDKTVVLIYDTKGKLRDVETNLGDQSAEITRIVAIAKQLQGD
jgi:hypothetical protein